jgi:pimeloyl-ACP methyl ester carboxylesterase
MIPPERVLCIAPGIAASLAIPNHAASIAAIVLPTDALPRSGPGRLHAMLCRQLAAAGIPAMRFDPPNLDAGPAIPHEVPSDHPPARESVLAMDAFERATRVGRFLLIGTGAGAYGAFHAALSDRRVAGIALINPHDFVGDPAWSAMVLVQRYLQRSSRSMRSWINLVNGRADYRRIVTTLSGRMMSWVTGKDAVAKARAQAIAVRMRALIERGCRVMCLVADSHLSLDHTLALFGSLDHQDFQSFTISGADHLMRAPPQREEAIERLVNWAVCCSALPEPVDGITGATASDHSGKALAGDRRA